MVVVYGSADVMALCTCASSGRCFDELPRMFQMFFDTPGFPNLSGNPFRP
jgi:hypothetical protein